MKRRVSFTFELHLLRQHLHQALELAYPSLSRGQGFTPLVDLAVNQRELLLRVDVPGVEPKSLKVQLQGQELRISGEKKGPPPGERRYHQVERSHGPFQLEVILPEAVSPQNCRARVHAGVLEVRLARQEQLPPQPITIPVETEEL